MFDFSRDIDDMFNRLLSSSDLDIPRDLRFEISEDDNSYFVEADLPGIKKEDINIELKNNMLSITAERKCESEKKSRKFYRSERFYGKFSKSISIPENADTEKVDAKFEDGVLTLNFPKKEKKEHVKKITLK